MKGLRLIRLLFVMVVLAVTLVAVGLTVLLTLDLSPYRGPLEARLNQALGRHVRLGGPIRIRPHLLPTLTVEDVAISNPRWASDPYLARAERLTVQIALLPLLEGRVLIDRVVLVGGRVHLEIGADGRNNWMVPGAAAEGPSDLTEASLPRLPHIVVRRSAVDFRDARTGVVTPLTIERAELVAQTDEPLALAFVGSLRGRDLAVAITGGPPNDLLNLEAPWPLRVAVSSEDDLLTAGGELRRLPHTAIDLRLHASGPDFTRLDALLGVKLPPLGPFGLDARLVKDAAGYRVTDLQGFFGPEGSDHHFRVNEGRIDAPVEGRTKVSMEGIFRDLPFELSLDGAAYPELLRQGGAWPVRASVRIARTQLELDGEIQPDLGRLSMRVDAEGQDLSSLEPLLGLELPSLGPYRIRGRLHREGDRFALRGFDAKVGRSDLRGDLALKLEGARPHLSGAVQAGTVHLDDFRSALRPVASVGARPDAPLPPLRERILPAGRLQALDAGLEVDIGQVLGAPSRVEELRLSLNLRAGDLTADPFHVRLAGEVLDGRVTVDTGPDEPVAKVELRGRNIHYGPVLAALHVSQRVRGRADALDFTLDGQGRTLDAILHSARLRLVARNGTVNVLRSEGEPFSMRIDEGEATTGGGEGLELKASGRYRDTPFTVTLSGDGIPELDDDTLPWHVRATGTVADVKTSVEGEMRAVFEGEGVNLKVRLEGPRLAVLGPVFEADLPDLGPFLVSGRLMDSLHGLRVTELDAHVGESDAAGMLRLTSFEGQWRLNGTLHSQRLRYADLAPGAADLKPAAGADDERVIPDWRFPVDLLRAADVELEYTAKRVEFERTRWSNLDATVRLQRGDLNVKPFSASVWGGGLAGSLRLDASRERPLVSMSLAVQGLRYTDAFQSLGTVGISNGTADFAVELKGRGPGLREAMATANGTVEFFGGSGRVNNELLNFWAPGFFLGVVPNFSEKDASELRCAVAHFDVAAGMASTKSILLDVERVLVKGNGSINLQNEELDFIIWPETRDRSIVSSSTPLRVTGTLGDPSVAPQAWGILQDVAWLLIGAANPPALLVGFVKPSAVESNPCVTSFNGKNGKAKPQDSSPPNVLSKTGDFFRGLGNLLTRPFRGGSQESQ